VVEDWLRLKTSHFQISSLGILGFLLMETAIFRRDYIPYSFLIFRTDLLSSYSGGVKLIRTSFFVVLILFCAFTVTAFGDESGKSPATDVPTAESEGNEEDLKPSYLRDRFQFTVNAGAGISRYQWHFSGGIQADFNANPVLGIGLRTTVDYGLKYDNLNINLYVLYKIWWFYVGPGVSFLVQGITIPTDDAKYAAAYPYDPVASLALTAGARFPVARIGPGFLTVDISVDWYQTDTPLTQPTPPITGETLDELLNGSIYAFKIAARLGYTF